MASTGNTSFTSRFFRECEKFVGQINFVGLDPACANRNSLRLEKRVRHRAANQNRVGLFHQRLHHSDFIRHFRAAHDDDERFARVIEFLVQIVKFLFHQQTHRRLSRQTW